MGREAHLMRLALGRSALETPEDSATFTASRAGDWTSAVHPPTETGNVDAEAVANRALERPPPGVQLFNDRGHPFNPWSRSHARMFREAQNDILSVIGITERKHPTPYSENDGGPDDGYDGLASKREVDPEEDMAGDLIGHAADIDFQILEWWSNAFTNRLLVFPPSAKSTYVEALSHHFDVLGWTRFFFAGLPSFMLSHIVNPEMWTQLLLYSMHRAVMAKVSSKKVRERYENAQPVIAGFIEVLLNVFAMPFRLHSMLQLLGFQPPSWYGLPHPRSWIPFCGTSLIRWSLDARPLLPFFAYRPISSMVHQYLFMSIRPTILEPSNFVLRRRSSGSRFAASVNAAPIIELPAVETALTGLFRRAAGALGWGRPAVEEENLPTTFQPGLRRRETWPVEGPMTLDLATSSDSTNRSTTQSGSAELDGQGDEVQVDPLTEVMAESTEIQEQRPPPPLRRVDTVATTDGDSPTDVPESGTSDATIRVHSVDPETGAVNLEIGLPEEILSQRAVHVSRGEATQQRAAERQRQRRGDATRVAEAYSRPHHVSRLALEPAECLASLVNGWTSALVLLPLRALVLRQAVSYVLAKPQVFGLDAVKARSLPARFGSSFTGSRADIFLVRGVGNLALSFAVDVTMGLGFWLAEWALIRYVGITEFGWGKF